MKASKAMPIDTVGSLRQHLQWAVELEHATIPAYLCGLYSIKEGTNQEAADIIRSVVMEEMLHMTLACNLLNAVGGSPSIDQPEFVPSYPTYLPHSADTIFVHLGPLSQETIATFLAIEHPKAKGAPPEAEGYHTIGQFYAAIEDAFKRFAKQGGEAWLFSGDPSLQIQPDTFYYGGGGKVVAVHDLATALEAMEEIVEQGEGVDGGIFDGDCPGYFGQGEEYAHYFRFKEVKYGRFYSPKQDPKGDPPPRGKYFAGARERGSALDEKGIYPMQTDPKTADYPRGSELWQKSAAFNGAYTGLLHTLHRAFNGKPDKLLDAVGMMYQLKELAQAMMRTPLGKAGQTAGPSFEYWPPPQDSAVITIPEFRPLGPAPHPKT